MALRCFLAMVLIGLGCSCSDRDVRNREHSERHHAELIAALKFRQIYDADELAERLRKETDARLVMADVLGSTTFLSSQSHYLRLAPGRPTPTNIDDEVIIRAGTLRLIKPTEERVVSYVFPESRPRGGHITLTGEQWGGERMTFDYTGGEWDSGYYPAHGYYVEPVVLVLAMNGVVEGQPLLAAPQPDFVPPTYVLPRVWRDDVKSTLADWSKPSAGGDLERYLGKVSDNYQNLHPLSRLMAWQILLEGDASEPLGRLGAGDFGNDSVFTGALTYRVLRYGSEEERITYGKSIARIIAKAPESVSMEGLILGAAEACTKFRLMRTQHLARIQGELRLIDARELNDTSYNRRLQLVREAVDLSRGGDFPASVRRLLAVLNQQAAARDQGMDYILRRIVRRHGEQAEYPDRLDRIE